MSNERLIKSVRLSASERTDLLDRLDDPNASSKDGTTMAADDRRADPRWRFRRDDVVLEVEHPGGGVAKFLVCARNLAAGGMSFIHGGFLYPGSKCRIIALARDETIRAVAGQIVFCRHVGGAQHEVNVRFDERIDPRVFLPAMAEAAPAQAQASSTPE